jgi:hypothetical protein
LRRRRQEAAGRERLTTSVREAIANVTLFGDYDLLFLFCIPVLWGLLVLYDRIQYRLRA